jgi:hypothetical protein
MDWRTILILSVVISGLLILWLRIESRIRPPVIIVLYVPSILLILKWSQFREAWTELGTAAIIAVAIFLAWWIPYGRKLPPPKGSQIVVITPDDDNEK